MKYCRFTEFDLCFRNFLYPLPSTVSALWTQRFEVSCRKVI